MRNRNRVMYDVKWPVLETPEEFNYDYQTSSLEKECGDFNMGEVNSTATGEGFQPYIDQFSTIDHEIAEHRKNHGDDFVNAIGVAEFGIPATAILASYEGPGSTLTKIGAGVTGLATLGGIRYFLKKRKSWNKKNDKLHGKKEQLKTELEDVISDLNSSGINTYSKHEQVNSTMPIVEHMNGSEIEKPELVPFEKYRQRLYNNHMQTIPFHLVLNGTERYTAPPMRNELPGN